MLLLVLFLSEMSCPSVSVAILYSWELKLFFSIKQRVLIIVSIFFTSALCFYFLIVFDGKGPLCYQSDIYSPVPKGSSWDLRLGFELLHNIVFCQPVLNPFSLCVSSQRLVGGSKYTKGQVGLFLFPRSQYIPYFWFCCLHTVVF